MTRISELTKDEFLLLQDVYELDIAALAEGKIGKRETKAKLSAQDCLFMGKHCYNGGVLSRSIEWFEEAWMLAGEEENATVSQAQVKPADFPAGFFSYIFVMK